MFKNFKMSLTHFRPYININKQLGCSYNPEDILHLINCSTTTDNNAANTGRPTLSPKSPEFCFEPYPQPGFKISLK